MTPSEVSWTLAAVVMLAALLYAFARSSSDSQLCASHRGHWYHASASTKLCLTADGRVLEL